MIERMIFLATVAVIGTLFALLSPAIYLRVLGGITVAWSLVELHATARRAMADRNPG